MEARLKLYIAITATSIIGLVAVAVGAFSTARLLLAALSLILLGVFTYLLVRARVFTVDLLMAVAGLTTAYYGLVAEGLIILALYGFAEASEEFIEEKAERSIESLVSGIRKKYLVEKGGSIEAIDTSSIRPGDVVIVRVGEMVPVDGAAASSGVVDESLITGEPVPVEIRPGMAVKSGARVLEGPLRIMALRSPSESYAQKLAALARESLESKPHIARLLEKMTPPITASVIGLFAGLLAYIGPERALPVLLVGCPSAYILSSSFLSSYTIALLARRGVLAKSSRPVEALPLTDTVVMDKTGTLTALRVDPSQSRPPNGMSIEEFLGIIGDYALQSKHPVSRALHSYSRGKAVAVKEVRGKGLLGSGEYRVELSSGPPSECGKTLLARINGLEGLICLQEQLLPGARDLVEYLKSKGYQLIIASGDDEHNVARIAENLGVDEYYGSLRPEDKAGLIDELHAKGRRVVFIGDGLNDSIALSKADVGVGVGDLDAVQEVADIAVNGTPSQILALFGYGLRLRLSIASAFALATIVKVIVGGLGILGALPLPIVAFLGDDGSTLTGLAGGLILLIKR